MELMDGGAFTPMLEELMGRTSSEGRGTRTRGLGVVVSCRKRGLRRVGCGGAPGGERDTADTADSSVAFDCRAGRGDGWGADRDRAMS